MTKNNLQQDLTRLAKDLKDKSITKKQALTALKLTIELYAKQ